MIDSERTGITINDKPYGNPDRDLVWNVREGIKQMTMDGDEMRITGLVIAMSGWAFADGMRNATLKTLDIPFKYTSGPTGFSDCYFIRRTGL